VTGEAAEYSRPTARDHIVDTANDVAVGVADSDLFGFVAPPDTVRIPWARQHSSKIHPQTHSMARPSLPPPGCADAPRKNSSRFTGPTRRDTGMRRPSRRLQRTRARGTTKFAESGLKSLRFGNSAVSMFRHAAGLGPVVVYADHPGSGCCSTRRHSGDRYSL